MVVADVRAPRDGRFIEVIGHYDPLTQPETVVIDEEKALRWLRQGAQPTATASSLLSRLGIMDKFKGGNAAVRETRSRKVSQNPLTEETK